MLNCAKMPLLNAQNVHVLTWLCNSNLCVYRRSPFIYDKSCATKDMKRWSFTKARIMMMLTNRFDELELKLQQDLANLEDELAAMVRSIAQWEREKMMVPMNDVAEYIASENLVTSEAVNLFRQPSFRRIFRVPEDSTHFVRA